MRGRVVRRSVRLLRQHSNTLRLSVNGAVAAIHAEVPVAVLPNFDAKTSSKDQSELEAGTATQSQAEDGHPSQLEHFAPVEFVDTTVDVSTTVDVVIAADRGAVDACRNRLS